MKQWNYNSSMKDTCCVFHCKYFSLCGCEHPFVEECIGASLYWPWSIEDEKLYCEK